MRFWSEVTDGPGYICQSLAPSELAQVRAMITAQYLEELGRVDPALRERAATVGIEQYHTLPISFDHGEFWEKKRRVLPADCVQEFEKMGFFKVIRAGLPSAKIFADDLMWRVVRPEQPTDVGPVHADKWFWDAGNGSIPDDHDRLKVWIGVATEPGRNGLCVKGDSHRADHWKRHFEFRHGKMKPVLDENPDDLAMELLPLKSGELVLFHDAMLHGGVVNRGSTCRVSIELTITFPAIEGDRLTAACREARRAA